jgi:hypothetical protein
MSNDTGTGSRVQRPDTSQPPMVQRFLRQKSDWLKNLPARTCLKMCNSETVRTWLGARHQAALARHSAQLPRLDPRDGELVDTLRRDGIAVTSIEALGLDGSQALLARSLGLARSFAPTARKLNEAGQVFVIVPPKQLVANRHIIEWGLQDRLLDIAEAYIGLPPAYDGVAINYTVADGRQISTRRWHRDWEDRRVLKVAVYLHDVGPDGSPFEVLRRSDTMQSDARGYSYELADDADLAREFGEGYPTDIMSCTGSRGTVIFADTARLFHRGKPATKQDRAALFYSYFSSTPRHPFFCERTGLARSDLLQLSRTLPPRQRDAIAWWRTVPFALRAIPLAPL